MSPSYAKCPRCGYRLIDRKELQKSYPKAFAPWLPQEDRDLQELVLKGASILDIAETLARQPTAIQKRIEKLGFDVAPLHAPGGAVEPARVPDSVDPL